MENKQKRIYSRTLSNRMTIVAWKLFNHNRRLHFAFIVYRLRRDFGFTYWEIANFTGLPTATLRQWVHRMMPLLKSQIIQTLVSMDYDEEEDNWEHANAEKDKKYPAWYDVDKYKEKYKEPDFKLGGESEKEWLRKMSNLDHK